LSQEKTQVKTAASRAKKDDPIFTLLKNSRTIAVVGLSSKHARASYGVAQYLQGAGYRIIPVNPKEKEVLGEKAVARLEDIREPVHIVNVFRKSEHLPALVEAAIAIGAKAVWMQEGVVHEEAAERARRAGLFVAMDSCILKEHVRRFRAPG
jgi:predicted CoA-binding protein